MKCVNGHVCRVSVEALLDFTKEWPLSMIKCWGHPCGADMTKGSLECAEAALKRTRKPQGESHERLDA